MRINKIDSVYQVYNKSKVNKVGKDHYQEQMDQLKISERALDFQHALNRVKDVEDIRTDKVNNIKTRIEAGSYNVSGREIANKMVDSLNFDKKI